MKAKTGIFIAVPAALVLLIAGLVTGPHSGQIRVDCGDIRYFYFGIPLECREMREPERSKLLSVTKDTPLSGKWMNCSLDRPNPTNSTFIELYRGDYLDMAQWASGDRNICLMLINDRAGTIKAPGETYMSFEGKRLLRGTLIEWTQTGGFALNPNWRDDPDVQEYCKKHDYTIPDRPTPPTAE